jgi:hypothetical protein
MPKFSGQRRAVLLSLAHALVPAARDLFPGAPDVAAAADRAELAALALEEQLGGRSRAGSALSDRAAGVLADELALERRVSGLSRALRGLADLGSPGLDELHDALFPDGAEPVNRPDGRSQVAAWRLLVDRIAAARNLPAAAPHAEPLDALARDLLAWCDLAIRRDDALRARRGAVRSASEAAEDLRLALQRLDLEVERAAGGTRAEPYQSWAAVAAGLA